MDDPLTASNGTDNNRQQVEAREDYFRLREKLVVLESSAEPNAADIDAVIRALEKAQLAYKATHGLVGNNPIGDPPNGNV